MEVHAFPSCPGFLLSTDSAFSLKNPVPPSTYQKRGSQFVLPTHPLWKRHCHLFPVPHVQKSWGKTLVDPARGKCSPTPLSCECEALRKIGLGGWNHMI